MVKQSRMAFFDADALRFQAKHKKVEDKVNSQKDINISKKQLTSYLNEKIDCCKDIIYFFEVGVNLYF